MICLLFVYHLFNRNMVNNLLIINDLPFIHKINNYNHYFTNMSYNRGGGVLIYVKCNLKIKMLNKIYLTNNKIVLG